MSEENQERQEVEISETDIQDLDEMLDIGIICQDLIQRYPKISNPQFVRGKASVGTKTDFEFREAIRIKPAKTEMNLGGSED